MSDIEKKGWAWPLNSRKAHYFTAGELRSICMAWLFTGGEREDNNDKSPDNCRECQKRLEKRRARENLGDHP